MSVNGLQQPYVNNSLDGLVYVEVDGLTINGVPVDPTTFIPYVGATKPVSLGPFSLETLTSLSARQHNFTTFTSTIMTSPTTSSLFTADAWHLNNNIQISSLGGGAFLSTSYLHIRDHTNNSTLLTLQSDGIADFGKSIPRASTLATGNYDLVNLSTLSNAVAYLEGITSLNFVPYVGSLNALDMGGSTITTSGLMSAGALRITSSIGNADYSLSVNAFDQLEFCNLSNGSILKTNGSDLFVTGNANCATLGATNVEASGSVYLAKGSPAEWRVTLGLSDEYEILDNAGVMRSRLSKSTGLTVSTLTISQVQSATPTLALGVNGNNEVISFVVPSASGTVNTSTTSARFIPYLSTATTLTNSLLNQIDNDSMGFGYTSIPNYPLGSGGKNMYINGSIFAGALNSMFATFGRDTNTSNPANEITFTASGAGVLLTQIKSHSGSSAFVDATWTYSNTNPAPLGANQGQVLLTADKLSLTLTNGLYVSGNTSVGVAKRLILDGTGATEIYNGQIDTYNPTGNNNLMIRSWWGIGFPSYDNIVRIAMDTRTGNASFSGSLAIGNNITMSITKPIYLYYISATNHAGLLCESSGDMVFFTGTGGVGTRLTIKSGGNTLHTAGDLSYMNYGPNATWNSNLIVGATPDRAGVRTAQIITTNGNLHIDAGNSMDIYHGFYANQRGVPNIHRFYGQGSGVVLIGETAQGIIRWTNPDGSNTHWGYPSGGGSDNYIRGTTTYIDTPIIFNQAMSINAITYPQNTSVFSHVMTYNTQTSAIQRSQCMMRQNFKNENIAWTGGYQYSNAFFKFNATCPVRISGRYSYYTTSAGSTYVGLRIYARTTGVYYYYNFHHFQNISYAHTTYPLDMVFYGSDLPTTGWFDTYIYNAGGPMVSDGNDQLQLNVQVLPVDSF